MKILSSILLATALACSVNSGSADGVEPTEEAAAVGNLSGELYIADIEQRGVETQEKIIKTARLEFETSEPDQTYASILEALQSHDGFVQNDQSGKSYNRLDRNLTVRVPAAAFHDFITQISEGVPYFDHKDISQDDVTEEFIDLEARLKAKRALEQRYIELLDQAKNVKEILEVEGELSKVRFDIESKEGRLKYLKDRVAMSTATISYYQVTVQTGVTIPYGQKIKNAVVGGWDGISMFFIGALYLWPLWVLMTIGFLILRRFMLHRKRQAKN